MTEVTPNPSQQQPPAPYPPGGPAPAPQSSSNVLSILGIVFGVVAVLFVPILFGPAGIICAAIAKSKKERLSSVALAVSIAGMLLGIVIGAIVGMAMFGQA